MTVKITEVSKCFATRKGAFQALSMVSLDIPDGQMTVVVGPSGSGKTTLLRCIAGLEEPDHGTIEVGGRDVTALPPGERDIAMVFQDYALYPHLSVGGNIAFGLKARKVPAGEIEESVSIAAAAVGLDGNLDRAPAELSGGERQRVALARALVRRPSAFLLDEPLSNLDAELRAQTRTEIRSLQRRLGTTAVYVTHDQVEAMTMGDTVAVLHDGTLEQVGPPLELYQRPATAFVARFLGSPPTNLFPAALLGSADPVTVGVRPERIDLVDPDAGRLDGRVVAVEPIGGEAIVHVDVRGQILLVRLDLREAPTAGAATGLQFADADVLRFDATDGRRLG